MNIQSEDSQISNSKESRTKSRLTRLLIAMGSAIVIVTLVANCEDFVAGFKQGWKEGQRQ